MMRALLTCWLLLVALPAAAQQTLVDVVFEGNDTTRRSTLMRQLTVEIGQPIDDKSAEASRQSIQDLGLFKSVTAALEPVDGGQRLRITVDEKFYLLPLPRLDFNSDRELSFGGKLDWSNVSGLNHDLELVVEQGENAEDDLGDERVYQLVYDAPFVIGSHYDLRFAASHVTTPVTDTVNGVDLTADEREMDFSLGLFRQLGTRRFGKGWRVGGALNWRSREFVEDPAPPSRGTVTSVTAAADYRDLRDLLFSRRGYAFGIRYETTVDEAGSDFDFSVLTVDGQWTMPIGSAPHQTIGVVGQVGSFHGGSPNRREPQFDLGGGANLRGFDKAEFQGDAIWFGSLEYQRPVFGTQALRGLVIMDVGAVYDDWGAVTASDIQVDAGIGIRWRIQAFVDLTFEVGMAWPLTAGGSEPFFGKVR